MWRNDRLMRMPDERKRGAGIRAGGRHPVYVETSDAEADSGMRRVSREGGELPQADRRFEEAVAGSAIWRSPCGS